MKLKILKRKVNALQKNSQFPIEEEGERGEREGGRGGGRKGRVHGSD